MSYEVGKSEHDVDCFLLITLITVCNGAVRAKQNTVIECSREINLLALEPVYVKSLLSYSNSHSKTVQDAML